MIMNVTWEQPTDDSQALRKGSDEDGNIYRVSANGVITVQTAAGQNGIGWTTGEALKSALAACDEAIENITPHQRVIMTRKIDMAIKILGLASLEAQTATATEITETIYSAREILDTI